MQAWPGAWLQHPCVILQPAPFFADLQITPGGIVEVAAFDTLDGLYECAWSEENENILLAASGDGSIKVYDLGLPLPANPLRQFHEHKHEASDAPSPDSSHGSFA